MEAFISRHPQDKKKESVTTAVELAAYKNGSGMRPLKVYGLDGCLPELARLQTNIEKAKKCLLVFGYIAFLTTM